MDDCLKEFIIQPLRELGYLVHTIDKNSVAKRIEKLNPLIYTIERFLDCLK